MCMESIVILWSTEYNTPFPKLRIYECSKRLREPLDVRGNVHQKELKVKDD